MQFILSEYGKLVDSKAAMSLPEFCPRLKASTFHGLPVSTTWQQLSFFPPSRCLQPASGYPTAKQMVINS